MMDVIRLIGEVVSDQKTDITGKIFAINLYSHKKDIEISIEDFIPSNESKYLFVENEQAGRGSLPLCPLGEVFYAHQRIDSWLKKSKRIKLDDEKDKLFVTNISYIISSDAAIIREKITQKINEASSIEGKKFLTVKIDGKFLGEYSVFQKCFYALIQKKLGKSSGSSACSLFGCAIKLR